MWIVKLAEFDDRYVIARAEVMALRLAREVGIRASEADVLASGQRFPVAIVKRFDRDATGARIPFISAQTFMGLPGADPGELRGRRHADARLLRDPQADMRELFRRMLALTRTTVAGFVSPEDPPRRDLVDEPEGMRRT